MKYWLSSYEMLAFNSLAQHNVMDNNNNNNNNTNNIIIIMKVDKISYSAIKKIVLRNKADETK